jgi:hypothetical protein
MQKTGIGEPKDVVRTGVFATADEIAKLREEPQPQFRTLNSGLLMIGSSFIEIVHALALAHGLPEVRGYYGIDLSNGEFLGLPWDDESEDDRG